MTDLCEEKLLEAIRNDEEYRKSIHFNAVVNAVDGRLGTHEYTGWDNYIFEKTKRKNHPYSCGFHAALEAGIIDEFHNPYGTGYTLGDHWYVDYCPFCGKCIEK